MELELEKIVTRSYQEVGRWWVRGSRQFPKQGKAEVEVVLVEVRLWVARIGGDLMFFGKLADEVGEPCARTLKFLLDSHFEDSETKEVVSSCSRLRLGGDGSITYDP